ncbi:hypothetical protein FA13DRAFT_1432646 [Coprinellus micaceus]|uniref:Uncharacterized protein n=1 Tax=Coprinellus micaceus TaxID=71717 RepID=A0A4Y7TM10_COPMI|nr:hypothetical protein FA13DRAFT_1432646 [Coprinellus micaceus]
MVNILYWKHSNDFSLAWFSKRMVVGITAFCGLVIALVLSAILKAFDIASSPPRTVWQPVNVRHRYANLDEPEDPHHPATSASYAAGALFGRKPWQEKLPCVPLPSETSLLSTGLCKHRGEALAPFRV